MAESAESVCEMAETAAETSRPDDGDDSEDASCRGKDNGGDGGDDETAAETRRAGTAFLVASRVLQTGWDGPRDRVSDCCVFWLRACGTFPRDDGRMIQL